MTLAPPRTVAPALGALAAALLAAGAARADVFSPGELARAHQGLEGLAQCTKCHVAGEQLSGERCLECHGELRERIARGRGWHGKLPAAERAACEGCHHEHQGRGFALVDWGKEGRKGFDHARTGYELRGKHRRGDCGRCHDRRLVRDPAVLEALGKQPDRVTYLGAPTACAACHFDEHRGQLGADCQRCHAEDAWKPARGFQHARTAYPLAGKHARVACAKCHAPEPEAAPRAPAPAQTAPVNPAAFVRYKGKPFQACTDCHKDPHQGRFGAGCTGCHTPADWKKLTGAGAQRAFHEKTRYPLRGAHADARCEACHGPFPGVKARFKGIPFERCTDCHADAHLGQLASLAPRPSAAKGAGTGAAKGAGTGAGNGAPAAPTCDACHQLERWIPARFEADDHARLSYGLEGAHRAVACALCHPRDQRLEAKVPAAVRADLARRKRPLRVSLALLDVPRASDCRTCHRDPHGGQFEARTRERGCAACHDVDSFRKARFDHAKDSRFPLEGKHAPAACGSCHRPDAGGVVRYRPLAVACAGCHADPHARQLAAKGQASDCARCHTAVAWKDLLFRHEPPFTKYALEGKHRRVDCARCHAPVRIAGADVRRYRPVPTACEGCHADHHRGAFRAFAPAPAPGAQPAPARTAPAGAGAARADLSARVGVTPGGATRCAACHTAEDWKRGAFAHERTGFPLEGAHTAAECAACHGQGTLSRAVPRACAACHGDVHAGRLGARCERCHEATAWRNVTFDADAHRRGAFPLTGRHAFTPCDSCHGDRRDRRFERPVKECIACHQADWARASSPGAAVDHAFASFPQTCQTCHTAWRFSPAGFPAHDACFAISGGPHAGVRCEDCHTTIPAATPPFTCQTDTADCIRCHSCSEHEPVPGFACANRKCYECHAFATVGAVPRSSKRAFR
jgi:hypothetical protein